MNNVPNNIRMQGVRIPENQSNESAPSMQVTNVALVQVALIEWGNERGQKERSVAFIIGDTVYVPPGYATWTTGFRSLVKALSDQVITKLETILLRNSSAAVPTSDSVDVMGTPPKAGG